MEAEPTIPPEDLGAIPPRPYHQRVAHIDIHSLDADAALMLQPQLPGTICLLISAGPTVVCLRHPAAKARELAAALVAAADAAEGVQG